MVQPGRKRLVTLAAMATEQEIEDIADEVMSTLDDAVANLTQEEAIEVYNTVAYHAKVGAEGIREDMK